MQQLAWTDKYTKAVEHYLEVRDYEVQEDHTDEESPYFITVDNDNDDCVLILLRAWDDEFPYEVDPKLRQWCVLKMAKYIGNKEDLPLVQAIRFDIIDMLVLDKRGLIRHHVNALSEEI